MNKGEAIQSVKDMCERHKQNHKHYPATVQVSGEVWQALVEPGYIFPPHAEPSVIVRLMDMEGIFSPELDPLAPIPVVKVIPQLPKMRHDGILHGKNPYYYIVRHIFGLKMPRVASVRIGHEEVSDDEVWLSPKQALSLLEWLTQEQSTLEQLAQEQEHE